MAVKFTLLKSAKTFFRPDVLPFLIIYAFIVNYYLNIEDEENEVYMRLALILIVLSNSIVFLSSYWSKNMKARI